MTYEEFSVNFLKGDEKILEIGGNYGRNSCIIATVLKENSSNLVILENNEEFIPVLEKNKTKNSFKYHIETSILCSKKLIKKNNDIKPSELLEENYEWIPTITYEELLDKYKINFDTLFISCEGTTFYFILNDNPKILENINMIIMENDYQDLNYYIYVKNAIINNCFMRFYKKGINNNYLNNTEFEEWKKKQVCLNNFFEVWKRIN